jgi:hypothetical protein
MWFCKDKRGEVKEAHPEWGVADIGKEMGALWKKISDKDKKKYEGEAAKDKERYEKVGAACRLLEVLGAFTGMVPKAAHRMRQLHIAHSYVYAGRSRCK